MKILYGIQGTGNGHLSRARAMARHFSAAGVDVTYLITGRPCVELFGVESFGDFEWRRGMTFSIADGRVSYLRTVLSNNLAEFFMDVMRLPVHHYDVVVNDFEPVSAWAARLRGVKLICLGHQPAFRYDIPKAGADPIASMVLRHFAPGDIHLGLHWHHFWQDILPPIIQFEMPDDIPHSRKMLVYLPFEDQSVLERILSRFTSFDFYLYSSTKMPSDEGNLHRRCFSIEGFRHDLHTANGVMCNAGFELPSEALQMGKKLLVKPVHNQMEQASNALALQRLGLATCMDSLNAGVIEGWLSSPNMNSPMNYPDVAGALVQWILGGQWDDRRQLTRELWKDTRFAF